MEYSSIYKSPLGKIIITEQNCKLTGLKFLQEPLNGELKNIDNANVTPVIKKNNSMAQSLF